MYSQKIPSDNNNNKDFITIKMVVEFNGECQISKISETSIQHKNLRFQIENYLAEYEFAPYGNADFEETHIMFTLVLKS